MSDKRGSRRNHALYFLGILSYVVSLLPFTVNWTRAIILLFVIAYTLPIMEYLQPRVMTLKMTYKDFLLIIPTVVPYLFIKMSLLLIIPAILLILTFVLYYTKLTMWGTVVGTTFEASLSIVWGLFMFNVSLIPIYWLLYVLTGALYVEYKLPFRKVSKRIPQLSWVISLVVLSFLGFKAGYPLTLLSLIEPSSRFLNPGEKLKSAKEIKELGKSGAKRDILFVIILGITYFLSKFY